MSNDEPTPDEPTPDEVEARGLELLAETGAAIVAGVAREAPGWVVGAVTRLLDAWGRADDATRTRAMEAGARAGPVAAKRVEHALAELIAKDPADQRATPLEIVRTLSREPTEILVRAGVPPVVRDPFDERSWPEDRYDLVPRTLADLGDPDLGPLHLAWGMAKATVLRARTVPKPG